MLFSSYAVYGLMYFLPKELGVNVEYYMLEILPIVLNLTVCIIFTSLLMDFFEKRNRQNERDNQEAEDGAGQNDPDLRNDEGVGLFSEIVQQLNTMVLMLVMLGCEFLQLCCDYCFCSGCWYILSLSLHSHVPPLPF